MRPQTARMGGSKARTGGPNDKPARESGEFSFSKVAQADLWEWLGSRPDILATKGVPPDLAARIAPHLPVDRRRDRRRKGSSKAGRKRDPGLAGFRFLRTMMAWREFNDARFVRDAEETARSEGVTLQEVLCRSMSAEEADMAEQIARPVLDRAKSVFQHRRRRLTDTALRQACGLTARSRPIIERSTLRTVVMIEHEAAARVRDLRGDEMRARKRKRARFAPAESPPGEG